MLVNYKELVFGGKSHYSDIKTLREKIRGVVLC
jgi:hypothetical protein